MGLLDTWNEWKQDLSPYADKAGDRLLGTKQSVQPGQDTMRRGDGLIDQGLDYAGGKIDEAQEAGAQYFQGEKVFDPATGGPTKRTGVQSSQSMKDLDKGINLFDKGTKKSANFIEKHAGNAFDAMFPNEDNAGSISEGDKQKILNGDKELYNKKTSPLGENDKGTIEKLIGVDFDTAKANWKDKGGMEGLMSNPAFSLGLALMQSSANGKTINQGILNNFVKSAKISSEFKDRIEARKQEPIQATAGDVDEIKQTLKRFKISDPNIWEKGFSWLKGENATADFDRAAESIAIEYQKEIAKMQRNNKTSKPLVIDSKLRERIIKKIVDSKGVARKKSWFGPFTDDTLAEKSEFRAQGGPITQGKPYIVGEKGPEIIIPRSDGNVLSNDDSQIYAMLLASNPQLQKVSRQRAEKVLRNRFPEYFEG